MAHRCRDCGFVHFGADTAIRYPWPAKLVQLDAVMSELMEAAREFEASALPGAEVGTPVEFCQWLSIETRRAAIVTGSRGGLTARIK